MLCYIYRGAGLYIAVKNEPTMSKNVQKQRVNMQVPLVLFDDNS